MKVFGIKSYLYSVALITIFSLFVSLLRLHTTINLVRLVLLLFLFNNTWFILGNVAKLRFRITSILLLILLAIAFLRGLVFNNFSERIVLDVYKPLSFILIFELFSSLDIQTYKEKLTLAFKNLNGVFFKASVFFALLAFTLLLFLGGYPGMRLPAILPAAYLAVKSKKTRMAVLIVAILLSGKRAVLLAIAPALIILYEIRITLKKTIIVVGIIVVGVFVVKANWDTLYKTKGVSKFIYTFDQISKYNETKDLQVLNYASGRRLQEITSSVYGFTFLDYAFGAGVGYTFDVYDIKREKIEKENSGNVHFSPISILSTYGGLFMLLLYGLLVKYCYLGFKYAKRYNDKFLLMLTLILTAFVIESFFAFVLFILPFLPIVLGLTKKKIDQLKSTV